MTKITAIDGNGEPNKFADDIRNMRKNFAIFIEYQELRAKMQWSHFCALKQQGFTDAQAIEIVKGQGS